MSEPEEVLLEAAHAALARWGPRLRSAPPGDSEGATLADLRRRLDLFLAALCPGAPPIVPAEPSASPTWIGRIMRRIPDYLIERRAFPSTDGSRLRLPPRLDDLIERGRISEAYRILALQLALRAARGSPAACTLTTSAAARDLFVIAEATAVERQLASLTPGLRPELDQLRARALEGRSSIASLTREERQVETLLRDALRTPLDRAPDVIPVFDRATESVRWAEARVREWDLPAQQYRGVPGVYLWGAIEPPRARGGRHPSPTSSEENAPTRPGRTRSLSRRPALRDAPDGEDDRGPGMAMMPIQDLQESVEDPLGLQRPADRDEDADAGGLADSLSELAELKLVSEPGPPREVLVSEDPPDARAIRTRHSRADDGVVYPEWDWRAGAYRMPGAVVHTSRGAGGPDSWWEEVLRSQAPLVRHTRRRFERLHSRPVRLPRQPDGEEIDLLAYVEAWSDARAGHATDDRLYESVHPLRRDLALVLLVDVSASTDAWVEGRRRIVDVEKEALLVVHEGLVSLGERYAILAFAGEAAAGVRVLSVKDFDDRGSIQVRRAIAGLEPYGYTRLGAAIRHASELLRARAARHRVLLVLSDGKPNDVDEYEGRYGVEDSRMAVLEARQDGLVALCLTVDRECSAYLPRIFGATGFTMLRQVASLPRTLAAILQRLVPR